jgi:hypothetical protein
MRPETSTKAEVDKTFWGYQPCHWLKITDVSEASQSPPSDHDHSRKVANFYLLAWLIDREDFYQIIYVVAML